MINGVNFIFIILFSFGLFKNINMIVDNKRIKKLEEEIQDLDKQITLEEKEHDVIKNYQMKQGDYQIIIKVYEANDLEPRQSSLPFFSKSACDSFVEISIRDQTEKTSIRKETNNPIFDERFCFKFKKMTLEQLDRASISFNVYDRKTFVEHDALIGTFQLDWTNVYFKRNHEFYRAWLTLMDPYDQYEGITGYLLVDIAILGDTDEVTVHDSAYIKDPLTTMEDTVTMEKLQLIDYAISINLYRAQNLIPLDKAAGNVDAYVIAKFSGNKVKSKTKSSCNPVWNQQLQIGTGVPTKSKYVFLQVRNKNILSKDDIIGILKIPFIDLEEKTESRWGHLYGPPMTGKDVEPHNFATKMQLYGQEMGSHYRGRIMYQIVGKKDSLVKNESNNITIKFPFKPTPVVPLKTFELKIQLLNGFDLPLIKERCQVHVCIGQYAVTTGQIKIPFQGSLELQPALNINIQKMVLPEDSSQMPDIIIYYAKGRKQSDRISYVRIKAEKIYQDHNPDKIYKIYGLTGDLSLGNIGINENGGYLTLRAFLLAKSGDEKKQIKKIALKKQQFVIKSFVYRGKNFPPMNQTGDCDAVVQVKCGEGKSPPTEHITSYNPVWNEIVSFRLKTYDVFTCNVELGVICTVYDWDEGGQRNMIGNFLVKLRTEDKKKYRANNGKNIEFIYSQPKWYPVLNQKVDVGDSCFGYVLFGCAMFLHREEYLLGKIGNQAENKLYKSIKVNSQENRSKIDTRSDLKDFQLYIIGIRELQFKQKFINDEKVHIQIQVDGNQKADVNQKKDKQVKMKDGSVHLNQMVPLTVNVPKNMCLEPYIDFKLFKGKKFFGYASTNLYEILPKIKQSKGNKKQGEPEKGGDNSSDDEIREESEDTILDIDDLERQLNIIRKRKLMAEKRRNALKRNQGYRTVQFNKLIPPSELGGLPGLYTTGNDNIEAILDKFNLQESQRVKNLAGHHDPTWQFHKNEQEQQNQILTPSQEQKNNQRLKIKKIQKEAKAKKGVKIVVDDPSKPITSKNLRQSDEVEDQDMNKASHYIKQDDNQQHTLLPNLRDKPKKQNKVNREFMEQVEYNNSQKFITDTHLDLELRYISGEAKDKAMRQSRLTRDSAAEAHSTISNFQIKDNQVFEDQPYDQRLITYEMVEKIIQREEDDLKEARERMQNYKYAPAVKLSLFDYKNKKSIKGRETYQDYDTDPEEDLDIIPQWYKGRKILSIDLEHLISQKKKIIVLPICRGGDRIGNLDIRKKQTVGYLRLVPLIATKQLLTTKQSYYEKLLKIKTFMCRIYVLKGKSLISNYRGKPTTYLRFHYKGKMFDLKNKTYQKEDYNPEYYICHEVSMEIPGPSTVKIQVMEEYGLGGSIKPKILGFTEIDMQERYFMKKWHLFTEKKPIQLRNLYSEYGMGTQGRIQVWVDLIEKKNWLNNPPYKIHPPPHIPFQFRAIIWSTKDCVYKNQIFQSNDVFVRAFLGVSDAQETDTHWACRGVGNFNYRFKFKANYPPKPEQMYTDQLIVQVWDRDIVGFNNLIGQKRINLNTIHRIIEKAVKRKKPVKGKMKIREQSLALTEKFWFDVTSHKAKDEFGQLQSQGKVQISFQLVPIDIAEGQQKNGFGRSEPNVFPSLQEPSGRLNFNILHPLDFAKQLCGPNIYNSVCKKALCCLIIIIFVVLCYFLLGQVVAKAIVG